MERAGRKKLSNPGQKYFIKSYEAEILQSKSKVKLSSETKQISKSFIGKKKISISYAQELFPIKKVLSKAIQSLKE